MAINQELNSDEYSFDIEWLSAEKLQFKLLTLITVLADNHLAYRGTLSDVCAFLGLTSCNSRSNIKIKTAIDCLVADGFIHALKDGNTWTLTLTKSAERRSKVIRIKKEWYEVARNYKNPENSVDWSVVLKVWLYLIDNRKEIITSQEIADTLGVSVSVVMMAWPSVSTSLVMSRAITTLQGFMLVFIVISSTFCCLFFKVSEVCFPQPCDCIIASSVSNKTVFDFYLMNFRNKKVCQNAS